MPAAACLGTGRLPRRRVLPPARGHGGCANRAGARTKLAQPEATALCLPSPPGRARRQALRLGGPGCEPGAPASRRREDTHAAAAARSPSWRAQKFAKWPWKGCLLASFHGLKVFTTAVEPDMPPARGRGLGEPR